MSIVLYFTLVWFFMAVLTLGLTRYYKIALPKLNQRHIVLLLILEFIAIAIAIYFGNETNSSPYILITAIFLILVGWVKSNQHLLLRFFRGAKKRPWLWRINLLFEGSEHTQNIYFLGDWFQIVAIALVWNSFYSLLVGCIIYPATVFILSSINTRTFNKEATDKSELIRNEVWANFIRIVFRNLIIALLLLVPYAVEQRDLTLFFGSFQDALNLITTLAQVEATVLALVITFLFVLVEFTNAAYSPRLVKSFVRQWSFNLMVFLASVSIAFKFLLIANAARYINLSETPNYSTLIDLVLLLTILSVLGYFNFIRDIFNLMQPEAVARQILTKFDQNWIGVIRRNWGKQNRIERFVLSDEDPMILFERYLATTIERGDIYSTKVALVLLGDKISSVMNKDDGAIIDEYLFNRMGNIVDILADNRSDLGLEIYCDIINEITIPSVDAMKNSEIGMFNVPLGTQLLQHIAEKAIDFQLLGSGRRVIFCLDKRCEASIKALPAFSDLWMINPDNQKDQQINRDKFWKNDRQLEGVVHGYFSFFAELGQKAVKGRSSELAWTISYILSSQIIHIVDSINEAPYQRYLVWRCLWNLEEIVKCVCEEKLRDAIAFGMLSSGVEKIHSENTAMIVSNAFAEFVELLAKAEILDMGHVIDVAMIGVYLADNNPPAAIPILNSLGTAGEIIKKSKSDIRQDSLNHIHTEILGRIDQIENAGLAEANKEMQNKISLAAKNARKKLNQKATNKSQKAAKG